MGVPGFFLWLWKKYKSTHFVFSKTDISRLNLDNKFFKYTKEIDELLFDANCLIHPKCFEILEKNNDWTDINDLENKMIKNVINYIDEIIKFVDPKNLVYIAIDGVAPVAKMKQQRIRRFKSVISKKVENDLKKKHKKQYRYDNWTNATITPGTKFMKKLSDEIDNYIRINSKKIKFIFSNSDIPGEGEHKLLQYIYKEDSEKKYCIYGLDADLIFLALASGKKNTYLLREKLENSNLKKNILDLKNSQYQDKFNYVSIEIMKNNIIDYIRKGLKKKKFSSKQIIQDFIFICYFLGNDFLPHISSIDIKSYDIKMNGIDMLISAYIKTINKYNEGIINNEKKIGMKMQSLIYFLKILKDSEENFLIISYRKNKNIYYKKTLKEILFDESELCYETEKKMIENLNYIKNIDDNILLGQGKDSWKFRYYHHNFNCKRNQKKMIKEICEKYCEGLFWVANYYFKKCISWKWYYEYDYSPFVSDLYDYVKNNEINNYKFTLDSPVLPIEQLLIVLPKKYQFLLPKIYRKLMDEDSEIYYLYPLEYIQNEHYKRKYWQTEPILPPLEIENIQKQYQALQDRTKSG